ncbi:hypothetical protein BDFB_006242, partial [Asbolus verrucosus]
KICNSLYLYPLMLMLYGLTLFNIFYQKKNIFEVVAVFDSVSTFAYIVVRKTILIVHSSLYEEIIKDRSHLWSCDLFGKSFAGEFRKQMAFRVFLVKSLLTDCYISIAFRIFTPIFVDEYVLPDACFISGANTFSLVIIYSFEVLFYNEGVHKKLNRIYSEFFICDCLLSVGSMCLQFFIFLNESANSTKILRSLIYIVLVNALFASIVIPVSAIEIEKLFKFVHVSGVTIYLDKPQKKNSIMAAANNDYFQFTLTLYDFSGLRPSCKSYRRYLSVYVLFPLLLVMYSLIIFNIRYQNSNIFEIAAVFGSATAFGYLVVRKTVLLVHGRLFEEIIQERSHFWSYDLFGKDMGDKFRKQMAFGVSLIKAVIIGSCIAVLFHAWTPFFIKEDILPDPCFIPGNSIYSIVILYTLEILFYAEVTFLVGVFDAFFLLMCTDLKIQFILLNKTVRSITIQESVTGNSDENICWKKLLECWKHYDLLIRYNV